MKENATLAEMSDKDGIRNLRLYPMSISNNGSRNCIHWNPKTGTLRSLSNSGSALVNYINLHDLYNDYTPDSVLLNVSNVMCDMVSVLHFMSTHQWKKYKMFIVQKGIYKNKRILEEIFIPPMMSLTHMKEDKPNNLYLRAMENEVKANLRGMAEGRFG